MGDDSPAKERSLFARLFGAGNTLVASQMFVFIFGTSLGSLTHAISDWFTPKAVQQARQAAEEARADAALVAPFLANLDESKKSQFEATRAALRALDAAAGEAGRRRPTFIAVNAALDAVTVRLLPPTTAEVTPEVNRLADAQAALAETYAAMPKAGRPTATPPTPAPSTPPSTEPSPPPSATAAFKAGALRFDRLKDAVVYIQVGRDDTAQLASADDVVGRLRQQLVTVPRVERLVATKMPARTQVRYFNDEDQGRAQDLADAVSHWTGGPVYAVRPKLAAQPGVIELWYGAAAPR